MVMYNRRQFLTATGASFLGLAAVVQADDDRLPDGSASRDMITPEAQRAIDQGLAFLARNQLAEGTFGGRPFSNLQGNVAITSLAGLAFMAGGHQPGRGLYGDNVLQALRYVLDSDDGRGYLVSRGGNSHGPMYGHGFGTLFLAEVHGMVHDKQLRDRLRETLRRAIKLIVDHQNKEGGWRYTPESPDADISVTICQIMALRAARNAGLFVPKSTVDRCIRYVKNCQDKDGGFKYQQQGGGSQFARSAAGVVALQCAGIYKGPEIERGLRYLAHFEPDPLGRIRPDVHLHYYYGNYYAAQAMWTAGGSYWAKWYPAIREELLHHPEREVTGGHWRDIRLNDEYATAMACIILQIPNNYLPILQK
jgi:hypothetical protein